jgi:pilus assembly protein Flp/PilA
MEAGSFFHAMWQDETGVTAIEYAFIGSLIAVAIAVSVNTVGVNLSDLYAMVAGKVQDAISGN